MGAPLDRPSTAAEQDNPVGTAGLAFAEFSALEPAPVADRLRSFGFRELARHRRHDVTLWRQGDMDILLNADKETIGGRFAALHGPCVSSLAFRIADAGQALDHCLARGGSRADLETAAPVLPGPALEGIGGSLLFLVDGGLENAFKESEFTWFSQAADADIAGVGLVEIDHLTHNVRAGQLETWADFYTRLFNFREVFYLDARGAATGFRTRALKSPCNRICIPVNEPTEPTSQIQEFVDSFGGEGVQHIAFRTDDLARTMEMLANAGIPTQAIPDSYYDGVEGRLPGHGRDLARLKRNGILIDGDRDGDGSDWRLLLQIFTKTLVGPMFFELIERDGNEGFGEGNAKALFEAIERDQIERGVVPAS